MRFCRIARFASSASRFCGNWAVPLVTTGCAPIALA